MIEIEGVVSEWNTDVSTLEVMTYLFEYYLLNESDPFSFSLIDYSSIVPSRITAGTFLECLCLV